MILYNKSGVFLGMGNSELNLLGFEDMDEFRNYHNDIADLFINKPGYIFKFHNFSWIEYALHSGTPNKRVLLRTKNGKEIDISLTIHEIFLFEESNGSKNYFIIELSNAPSKIGNLSIKGIESPSYEHSPAPLFEQPLPNPSIEIDDEDEQRDETFSLKEIPEPLFQTQEPLFSSELLKMPFEETIESDEHEAVNVNEQPVTFEKPLTTPTITVTFIKDADAKEEEKDEEEETFHLKIDLPEESTPEALLSFDELPEITEPLIVAKPFDIVESAEHLGLDLGTFAELLDDYVHDLDTRMNEIAKAITLGETALGLEQVSHLQSVAHHLGIGELIEHFAYLEESLRHHDEEGKLHTLLLIENVIADFKSSLQ